MLGRFGTRLEKFITELVSSITFKRLSLMKKISSYKDLGNNKILVSYIPSLDHDIIKSHNLDFIKVASRYKDSEVQIIDDSSIVISAAVTAYARTRI